MQEKLLNLQEAALNEIKDTSSIEAVESLRVKYLGKKGEITAILKEMGKLSAEERPVIGQVANKVRESIEGSISSKKEELKAIEKQKKLAEEVIDVTMPSKPVKVGKKHPISQIIDEVSKIFKDLSVDSNEKINMSLTTLGPRKLFIPTFENGFIVDYASINFILQSHMHFIKENEDKKGHLFEDAIIQRLEKNNLQLWECKKILKHKDKTSKEIDISFCYKNVLYIGELKSNKMSMAFFEGDDNALEFRKKKLTKALNEVEEKAKWLLNHKEGKNYKIPETVNVIIPIIVSPFAEYIWSLEEELWINKTTPRICIASDLYKLATDEIINEVVKKPFAYYLI